MEVKYNDVQYIVSNKKILDDIDLRIKVGAINVIIGSIGSGKSSLVEMLNAVIYPTKGNVKVGQFNISSTEKIKNINDLRFNVGYISQFPEEQFFCENVKKEIAFEIDFFNYRKNNIDKRISDSLKMVGLDDSYLKRDPFSLSGGEARRVALASALVINPEILVIDEPTYGLDSQGKTNLIKILRTIKRRYNKTIIIVTNDVEFAHILADYIFVLDNGKVVLEGDKYDIFKKGTKLKKYGIIVPKIIEFELLALNKNKKLGFRDEMNDLIKDILRNI